MALPDSKHAGKAERTVTVLEGLNEPHGLAIYEGKLYVAENDKVRRYDWDEAGVEGVESENLGRVAGRRRALHADTSISRREDVRVGGIELQCVH